MFFVLQSETKDVYLSTTNRYMYKSKHTTITKQQIICISRVLASFKIMGGGGGGGI